ncbi:hypothetical protein [Pseudomonas sp. SIMBA_068]|uniref:hypothetical protein n=1 Tax=Pseudomonas sp. SIMBA_068 TaxID=3085808 RepID=UPI00397B14D0
MSIFTGFNGVSTCFYAIQRPRVFSGKNSDSPLDGAVKMKAKLLVHGSHARSITSPDEVERLLTMGWLLAAPKPKTRMAAKMRALNSRRRAQGWTTRTLWFSPEDLAAVKAALLPGESYAELFVRLVRKNSLM